MAMQAGALARLGLVYCLAALAGLISMRAGLPLPWMIGPLIGTALLALLTPLRFAVPTRTRPFGQVTVALQVGLYFSPAALGMVAEHAVLLVGMALATAICALLAARLLARMAGIPAEAALVATMPTSPVEAAVMAERLGIDRGPVILAQTLRIAAVVVLVPVAIYIVDGWPDRSAGGLVPGGFDPIATLLLYLLGIAGAATFHLLRISNPFFLGPLAFSALLTSLGAGLSPFHPVLLSVAQIVLGTWLGANFNRQLFRSAGRLAGAVVVSSLVFLLLCALSALALAAVTGLPWEELVLGAAPGGVTEMALTAKFLGQNVALITAFHLTRIFLIMPNIHWIVRLMRR